MNQSETMEHAITVKELKRLLADLDDEYLLTPNRVGNLTISAGEKRIGFIDLLKGQCEVELFNKEEDEPK